jgi:hypothetical protein
MSGLSSTTDELHERLRIVYGSNALPLGDAGDSERLAELEGVIQRSVDKWFVEVGKALKEIHDSRLYREQYETFEDYVRDRWGWERTRAYRMIEAAQVAGMLPIGNKLPNEAVARELAPLMDAPEVMDEVWQQALEQHGPKATAVQVGKIVRHRRPTGRGQRREAHERAEQRRHKREWAVLQGEVLGLGARAEAGELPAPADWQKNLGPSDLDELRRSIPPLVDYLRAVHAAITEPDEEASRRYSGEPASITGEA